MNLQENKLFYETHTPYIGYQGAAMETNYIYSRRHQDEPLLIMLCGLPGSGKSTIAKRINVSNSTETHPKIHSSDELREKLYGDAAIQGDNTALFKQLHINIKDDLMNGKDVIYDATNISKKTTHTVFE